MLLFDCLNLFFLFTSHKNTVKLFHLLMTLSKCLFLLAYSSSHFYWTLNPLSVWLHFSISLLHSNLYKKYMNLVFFPCLCLSIWMETEIDICAYHLNQYQQICENKSENLYIQLKVGSPLKREPLLFVDSKAGKKGGRIYKVFVFAYFTYIFASRTIE